MKIITTKKEYDERFWLKVDKEISDIFCDGTRCWEWVGSLNKDGYGLYYNGRNIGSHRYSYLITFGEFDTKLNVLHKCDNPKCVNPHHLFLGTQQDNMRDKFKKGRQSRVIGELSGNSKLKEKEVIKIYKMWNSGNYLQREIAKMFGVTREAISLIVNGKKWNYLFKKLNQK